MTNGDKIRSMTNNELFDFIINVTACECCSKGPDVRCNEVSCENGIIAWLEEEEAE